MDEGELTGQQLVRVARMRTHRGINFSSIAGEGLNGFPGFLIALFFLLPPLAGLIGLLVWGLGSILRWDWLDRWPIQRPLLALDGLVGLVLMIAAACAVYLLSQWRDKQLSARIQQELHKLNEGNGQDVAVPTTDDEIAEFARTWKGELGFGSFRAEQRSCDARLVRVQCRRIRCSLWRSPPSSSWPC
jgi:hypothetical protein